MNHIFFTIINIKNARTIYLFKLLLLSNNDLKKSIELLTILSIDNSFYLL